MAAAKKRLLLAAGLYIILTALGTWLAVQEHLPAGFLGILNGQDPLRDALLLGTGLSAPWVLLVLQVALMFGLLYETKPRACTLGLIFLGCMYTLGQLGEPIMWQAFVPMIRLPIAALAIANLVCPVGMIIFGTQSRD